MKKNILNLMLFMFLVVFFTGCENSIREETVQYEDVYALVEENNAVFDEVTYYENYQIDEETGNIIKYESYNLNSSGNKTSVCRYELKYDGNGNKIREVVEGGYSGVVTRIYKYDNDVLSEFAYKSSKDNIEKITKYEYEFDENNKIIKEIEKEEVDEGDTIIYTYEYFEDGNIRKKHYQNDDYYLIYKYTYNDDGTIATETQESKNSIYKIEYEYDDYGNKTKEKVYKNGSTLVTYTNTFKYEIVGKKIKK